MGGEPNGRGAAIATGVALLVIAAASLWLRWPGVTQGGFGSHDVAGILHEAMVLHDGELPYVATIEMKAPGTFWLAKWLAGPDGTDIARFQQWAAVFAVGSLLIVGGTAWRVFGGGAAIGAAVLYGLHDLHLDSIDANYVTWAQTPMVAAAGLAMTAPTLKRPRATTLAWLGAGVLCGLTALCKRQPGVVVAIVLLAAWVGPAPAHSDAETGRPARVRATVAIAVGLVLSHVPIAVVYAQAGALDSLIGGYGLSQWGMAYVGQGGQSSGLAGAREGVLASVHFLALPLALSVFSVVAPTRAAERPYARCLWIWAVLALTAAWVGFRFYKGYFLAVLPPLCILGAAPWGLLGRRGALRRWWLRGLLLAPLLVLVGRQAMNLDQLRRNRARPSDAGGRKIAAHIGPRTQPGDRIWVWGWHLWDVYAFTGRRSASRVYKSIGLLTPPNDDTWRVRGTKAVFADGPPARILMEDLRAAPPAWIVFGSVVPHRQFTELRGFLREHYHRDRRVRIGRVQFWHRKDRAEAERRAATPTRG